MPPHLAAPVPPGVARMVEVVSQMETGFGPVLKYGPAGEAMTPNSTSWAGRTLSTASVAIMYGRRYRLVSPSSADGTHASSTVTSARRAAMNSSSGTCGSASRSALAVNRAAFRSGRNAHTEPSACRYAFRPSKISCE